MASFRQSISIGLGIAGIGLAPSMGGSQSLTQSSLFQNSNTFYTQSLQADQTLTQSSRFDNANGLSYTHTRTSSNSLTQSSRFDNSNGLTYAHSLSSVRPLTQSSRFDNSNTLNYAHTLLATRDLTQSSRFDNSNGLAYGHTLSQYVPLVQSTRFDNANGLSYAHTLTYVGPQSLTQASRFDNSNTLSFTHALLAIRDLTQSSRFDNSNGLAYTHTLATTNAVSPSLFTNSNDFFTHLLAQDQSLAQSARFDNSQGFYSHSIFLGQAVTQDAMFSNANTFYTGDWEKSITHHFSGGLEDWLYYEYRRNNPTAAQVSTLRLSSSGKSGIGPLPLGSMEYYSTFQSYGIFYRHYHPSELGIGPNSFITSMNYGSWVDGGSSRPAMAVLPTDLWYKVSYPTSEQTYPLSRSIIRTQVGGNWAGWFNYLNDFDTYVAFYCRGNRGFTVFASRAIGAVTLREDGVKITARGYMAQAYNDVEPALFENVSSFPEHSLGHAFGGNLELTGTTTVSALQQVMISMRCAVFDVMTRVSILFRRLKEPFTKEQL